MFRRVALFLSLVFLLQAADRLDTARIDAVAEAQRQALNAPGVAVAVVTKEQTYTRGYGVRSLDTKLPATTRTIFGVASLTKSFTALAAAMLVDEGKLDWDKPVREYLPWFRLYDPHSSELITTRDLLTHRSGLPRYDFLRYAVPLPREEIVRRLRYLPPTASFREKYQYQNLMLTAAGYLTGALSGTSWEELIESRIFAPLGMRDSTVRVADSRKREDYATSHERVGGVLRPVEFYDYQKFGVGPNGAVNASIDDFVQYLKFHLGDGTADGKRLLSRRQLEELHRPQMVIDEADSYALGWIVSWTAGFKLVSHGGSITGFRSWAGFAPERGEALAVFVNSTADAGVIASAIAEQILGWRAPRRRLPEQRVVIVPQAPQGPPTRPLSAYAGRYEHPAFGPCEVVESGGRIVVKFPALSLPLRHVRFDLFRTQPDPVDGLRGGGLETQFIMDPGGEFAQVQIRLEPSAPAIAFQRIRN